MSKCRYKRILLKLSGEALLGDRQYGIDPKFTRYIAQEVKKAQKLGAQIGIVIGGGNIFRGMSASANGMDRVTADYMGMMATIMNALALQDALESEGIHCRVQTSLEMQEVAEPFILRRAIRHFEKGRVVIFGGGTGNPYFTTDTTAALRAAEIGAEAVFKATNVDGIYDKDPKKHDDAVKYDEITYMDVLKKELRVMDSTAISLTKDNSIPVVVFDLNKKDNIYKAISGENIGTRVY